MSVRVENLWRAVENFSKKGGVEMLNFHLPVAQQLAILALQLGVILFAAKLCGALAKKCGLPSVIGELAAGIMIGPYVLGGIPLPLHGLENGLFGLPATAVLEGGAVLGRAEIAAVPFQLYHSSLYALAALGSVLLLFFSGLETDLRMFFRYSAAAAAIGLGGVIVSFASGAFLGMRLLDSDFMDVRCLFLGILCTATSVGITARVLSARKETGSPEGVTILAAAVIDDVLGVIGLAVVAGLIAAPAGAGRDWGEIGFISLKCILFWLIATVLGLMLARPAARLLKHFRQPAVFAVLAFALALLSAGIFEQQGLAMIIGAYVAGLSLSKTDISFPLQSSLRGLYQFLVPVFFAVMGMLADVRVFAEWRVLKAGLIYSLLAVLAKLIGCTLPALFLNFNWKGALRIGSGMIPRGEVALIVAGIGTAAVHNGKPVLDASLFGAAIIMTLLTTLLAPPLLSAVLSLPGKGIRKEKKEKALFQTVFDFPGAGTAEFVLHRLMETLKNDGWMFSHLDRETGLLQIRRDRLAFTLTAREKQFVFESEPHDAPLVKKLMRETFSGLHRELEDLESLAAGGDFQEESFEGKPPEGPGNELPSSAQEAL